MTPCDSIHFTGSLFDLPRKDEQTQRISEAVVRYTDGKWPVASLHSRRKRGKGKGAREWEKNGGLGSSYFLAPPLYPP